MSKAIMLNPPGGGGEEKIFVYPADVTSRPYWISNFPAPTDSTSVIVYTRKNPPNKEYQAVNIVRTSTNYLTFIRVNESGSFTNSGSTVHENAGAEYIYYEIKLGEVEV